MSFSNQRDNKAAQLATSSGAIVHPWYSLAKGDYDEMHNSAGIVRPHWNEFVQEMQELGIQEVERRHRELLKLLRENGVTYNVYGDPEGNNRPWQLDPIPLLISKEEWLGVEAGLLERAELLNLILTDLYGPRELIRKGLLPFELLYSHAGFLRACDKVRLPGEHQLVLYAADLARGMDGRLWVLSDRTQAPSGAGYALENRLAMSRISPDLFRNTPIQRLDRFFQSLRAGLNAIAPHQVENPRIVVLTPGPLNETFFEHAYMAAHLGYPLVQGNDLTVRDGYVWLKSLDGLQRIDVILRRVDDSYCDPLELREDSRLGVPGLLEAARRGNVAIANPLGSSVLENPALLPFLPAIAQHFLGRSLRLPSAATWWCGQPREREYVLKNLENLVIKPVNRGTGKASVFGNQLSRQQLAEWRERIQTHPARYVGQEHESFSSVPSIVAGGYEPRQAVLRCFVVACPEGYAAMPGGLTRSAPLKGDVPVSNQMGAMSKDTWIVASEPQADTSITISQPQEKAGSRYSSALSSRVADHLYWVGRYAERAEGSVRLLRTTVKKLYNNPDHTNSSYQIGIFSLLRSITHLTHTYPGFIATDDDKKGDLVEVNKLLDFPEPELHSIALDEDRAGSVAHTLRSLFQASYAVRDLWSADTWRVMDELEQHLDSPNPLGDISLWQMQEHLDQRIATLSAFSGLVMESMTRGNGWLFLDLGRRLERALLLISLLRSSFTSSQSAAVETQMVESLLDTSDNLICYRQHYRNYFELPSFFELLLLDQNNPRSLAYQVARIQEHLGKLPRDHMDDKQPSMEQQLAQEASKLLGLVELQALLGVNNRGERLNLEQVLSRLYQLLISLSNTVTAAYFQHGQVPYPLSASRSN